MGFECGVRLKEQEHNKDLFYLGRLNIYWDSIIKKENVLFNQTILDNSEEEIPNEGYEYVVSKNVWVDIAAKIRPLFKFCSNLSDRIIDELNEYIYTGDWPSDLSTKDKKIFKDVYYIADGSNETELYKLLKLYEVANAIEISEIDSVIYWRSW